MIRRAPWMLTSLACVVALVAPSLAAETSSAAKKPNIVFFLADDK